MRRLILAFFLLVFSAVPANALTVENSSGRVLYCSIYRQGYDMPLTQFVLLPGKKHAWTPAMPTSSPLVVRAMAERRLAQPSVEPAVCTVHNHLATVVANQDKDALVLGVNAPVPVR